MNEEPLVRYIASFPNKGVPGIPHELFYPDTPDGMAAAEAFAAQEDTPGRAVYDCVSLLHPGARKRCLETVAVILFLHADIDTKDVEESKAAIIEKLLALPYPPSVIRDSGHGVHAEWHFKESVDSEFLEEAEEVRRLRTRLTEFLCADPAPDHHAALLRRVGTTNTKDPESPVPCAVVAATRATYDPQDIADLLDDYGDRPLFTPREKPATNGHDKHGEWDGEHKPPVDVAERLAAMQFEGVGNAAIHTTQLSVSASELRHGCTVDFVVEEVLEATKRAVAGDMRCTGWDWAEEEHVIRGMCHDFINKNPELCVLLPDALQVKWEQAIEAGRRPKVFYSSHIGWHVRAFETKDGTHDTADEPARKPRGAKRALVLRPIVAFDPATLPPRQWLYNQHYQRGTVSLTAGPGGMGKSSMVKVECVGMATARNLLGEQPKERLKVWIHNGEDPMEEILRRLAAICQYYGIPQEELQGQLWLTSGNEFPLRVAKGYANLEIDAALVQQISRAISDNGIDVAAFDPLVTLHSVSENDTAKMDAVIRLFAGIADEHDCSVELNHHVRKPAAGIDADYDVHDIRGVVAITDAVRAARVLNRMSKGDAENAGLDEIARMSHFRVDKAKGNYSPARVATWRQFVSVDLPNTDSVGVVAPWDFPGQGEQTPQKAAADQQAEHVFLQLLDKFLARNSNVSTSIGPNYAPSRFAGEREAKVAKVSKAALRAAMNRLLDSGRVRIEPTGRNDRGTHRLVPWQGDPK